MKESCNSDEIEDINFVIHDLQYSSVLDIPFHIRVLHQLFAFFGKINTSITAPPFLGYIYYIIIIIQSFLPSFLIDCEDIWPKKSFISMILYILCYFYQGPHVLYKSYRVVMSIVVSIIFIILFITLIIRARHYQKAGRVSSVETKFFYFTFKYILPLFCPHIISGVTISFDQIVSQNRIDYNILCIILSIITLVFYLFLNYAIICPRVLFEDTPSHEWIPLLSVISILNTILQSCISGIAGCVDGKKRAACSICMLLISVLIGVLFFITNGVVKMMFNVVSSATYFGSAFSSLSITIVFFISKTIAPEIMFIISIVVFIVLIIVLKMLKQMKTTKMMMFLDSLIDSEKLADQVLNENYNGAFKFLCDIRSVIEMWHPIIANFEIFEFAVSKWPEKFDVLLFYSRILTIFPSKNLKMISIASKISNLPERKVRTSYLYQFRHFSRSRQTSVTPVFREKFEEIIKQTEISDTIIKKFWEDILQNNVSNFWNESENVISSVSELDSLYAQLIDDYTSNFQLLKSYGDFVQNMKHDSEEARDVFKKLENLRMNGVNDSDLALKIALQVFPNLNNCIELFENNASNDNNNENNNNNSLLDDSKQSTSENDENLFTNENDQKQKNDSELQYEILVSDLTKHSKLGSIWIECIILVLMTIVSIVLFYLLYDCYSSKFSTKQENAIKFLIQVNMLLSDLSYFSVNLNILPLVFENQTETQISILNASDFTERISPVLYENEKIPEFSLSTEVMLELLSNVKHKFTQTIEFLSKLDKKESMVKELNDLFYSDTDTNLNTSNSYTFNELMNNQILLAQDLLKFSTTEEFFQENDFYSKYVSSNYIVIDQINSLATAANDYCSNSYDSSQNSLNEIMMIANLVTLVCLALPYIIQMVVLFSQSEEIAQSFTHFPKTEIRSIINKYGESSSKIEDNEQTSIIGNVKSQNKFDSLAFILTFFASFAAIVICSLVIYFTAIDFVKTAKSVSNEINTLVPSFASLSLVFSQAFRIYMLTHDGTNQYNSNIQNLEQNVYYSGNDNFSTLIGSLGYLINITKMKISTGIYGMDGGLGIFYEKQDETFNYFKEDFPIDTEDIAANKTFFEVLATCTFTEAINHISDFLAAYFFEVDYVYQYSLKYPYTITQLGAEIVDMPSLIYWFSEFAEENRTKLYFKLIEDDVLNKIAKYGTVGSICFFFVILWQIIACILMLLYLLYKHRKIRKSLYFYNFFKPEVLLQNQAALTLIDKGRQLEEDNNSNYFSSESIFSKITQGCIIIQTDFKVINFNDSFINLFEMNDNNIIGKNLLDIVPKNEQDKTWDRVIWHAKNAAIGKYKTSFNENISVKLQSGKTGHFNCTILCMTPLGIANENEISKIDKLAFIFDENTEAFMRKLQIEKENKHLNQMLSNTMPSRIVKSFMNSNECISFIVQSVSIGSVRVKVQKHFDENTTDEFIFYNQIFKYFDDEIKNFDLLSKLNTFSHTYTFIGGLFSEINKPERHAEESIKFALNLLKIAPEISEKFGAEVQLTIGVHTGGPIVAGVINFEKPTFQIIGTVSEMANQMKNKGFPQTICISRAVYELIFSAGFKVQEQGDTTIRGGKVIPTSLVRL